MIAVGFLTVDIFLRGKDWKTIVLLIVVQMCCEWRGIDDCMNDLSNL